MDASWLDQLLCRSKERSKAYFNGWRGEDTDMTIRMGR